MPPNLKARWMGLGPTPIWFPLERRVHHIRHMQPRARWLKTTVRLDSDQKPAHSFLPTDLPSSPTIATIASTSTPSVAATEDLVRAARTTPTTPDGAARFERPADNLPTPDPRMQKASAREARKRRNAQLRFEATAKLHNFRSRNDWRDTLDKLTKRTPRRKHGWIKHAVKVILPPLCVNKLLYDLDYNLWEIHARTKAEVKLFKNAGAERRREGQFSDPAESGTGRELQAQRDRREVMAVVLSGDDVALRAATEMLLTLSDKAEVIAADPSDPDPDFLPVHAQTADMVVVSSRLTDMPVYLYKVTRSWASHSWKHRFEEIPKPPAWTQQSFFDYVHRLLTATMSPQRAVELYGAPYTAQEVKMMLVQEVFRDPDTFPCQTRAAFSHAIQCMEGAGPAYRGYARRIFTLMIVRKIAPDTQLLNQFLLGSSKSKDLHSFNLILDFMQKHECVPNWYTWRLFLALLDSEQAKLAAIRAMHSLGLLHDPHAGKDLAKEMIAFDTFRAMEAGATVSEMCQQAEARYGREWHSTTAMSRMVSAVTYFGRFDMALETVDHFADVYGRYPRPHTFSRLIKAAAVARFFLDALKVLRRWEASRCPFYVTLFDALFRIASSWRLPNVMAVVWTYACLYSMETYRMRVTVSGHTLYPGYALLRGLPVDPAKLLTHFEMPGYVPLDLQPLLGSSTANDPRIGRYHGSEVASLFRQQHDGFKPARPLSDALIDAFVFDQELVKVRQAESRPGSHVVRALDEGWDNPYIDIPLWRSDDKGTEYRTIQLPRTSTSIVHNYSPEWFTRPDLHPVLEAAPGACNIIWESAEQEEKALALGRLRLRGREKEGQEGQQEQKEQHKLTVQPGQKEIEEQRERVRESLRRFVLGQQDPQPDVRDPDEDEKLEDFCAKMHDQIEDEDDDEDGAESPKTNAPDASSDPPSTVGSPNWGPAYTDNRLSAILSGMDRGEDGREEDYPEAEPGPREKQESHTDEDGREHDH